MEPFWAAWGTTIVAAIAGYGELRGKVKTLAEDRDSYVRKDAFMEFQGEVLRRLERIENKVDTLNGRPSQV